MMRSSFRLFPLLLLFGFTGAGTIPPVLAAPPPSGVISPGVESRLRATPEGEDALWIYFKDKGFESPAAERRAVAGLPRPVARRPARYHEPDRLDLPVAPRYIDQVRALGATLRHTSRWLNAVSIEVPYRSVPAIAGLPFVRRIEVVRRSKRPVIRERPGQGPSDPGAEGTDLRQDGSGVISPEQTGMGVLPTTAYPAEEALHYGPSFNQDNQIGIVALHRLGYTGAGVVLAIFDTGFRTDHPATTGRRVIAERDFVFNDNDVDNEPEDNSSAWFHGTATWSNAAGLKAGALVGGAFEAEIILAKTEDIRSETPIEEDNYVAALEWADSLGADIVSASLAYLDFDGTANDYTYADLDGNTCVTTVGVDIAVSRGMAVVNAMGNSGPGSGTLNAPADADSVIAVGAVDSLGTIAGFSSRGPTADGRFKPEVVARGVRNFVAIAATNTFASASGTSFATPMTAGAATLLLEAHPDWDGFQLREALRTTASHPSTPDNNTGYGLVDAVAALNLEPPALPHVSLAFALIAPARGSTVATLVPELRWERSLPAAPGDTVTYQVIFSSQPSLTPADTFSVGQDTTWTPSPYLNPGTTWYWTVLATNEAGWARAAYMPSQFSVDATVDAGPPVPPATEVRLLRAAPNPARSSSRISFQLPSLGAASAGPATYVVQVFNAQGRLVRRLAQGSWGPEARTSEVAWDGRNDSGARAGAGIYFVSLEALGRRSTLKLVLTQ